LAATSFKDSPPGRSSDQHVRRSVETDLQLRRWPVGKATSRAALVTKTKEPGTDG